MKKSKKREPLTFTDWLMANQKQNFEKKAMMSIAVLECGEKLVAEIVNRVNEREMYEFHGNGD
jgi:hypothetical protein